MDFTISVNIRSVCAQDAPVDFQPDLGWEVLKWQRRLESIASSKEAVKYSKAYSCEDHPGQANESHVVLSGACVRECVAISKDSAILQKAKNSSSMT